MTASPANPKVNFYFTKAEKWRAELEELRTMMLATGLAEELKWGVPCYTFEGGNIGLIHYFKEYCAVLFPKGALLADPHGILIQQTSNTQGARQLRFTSIEEIVERAAVLKSYVQEAVGLEKAGLKVPYKATAEFEIPEELQRQLADTPALRTAFAALTPGRQRAYLIHFSAPKQATTREARVAKATPQILAGKGLND